MAGERSQSVSSCRPRPWSKAVWERSKLVRMREERSALSRGERGGSEGAVGNGQSAVGDEAAELAGLAGDSGAVGAGENWVSATTSTDNIRFYLYGVK